MIVFVRKTFLKNHKKLNKIYFFLDIPVRYHPTSTYLMHHKFCVFDGPGRAKAVGKKGHKLKPFLLTGSTNWTNDVSVFILKITKQDNFYF